MDINELENFRISDAVKFHNDLNPAIWDVDQNLRPEVRSALLKIAKDFQEDLSVKNVEIIDITVSGSNAAYSYTPHSDIDLHLIADLSKVDEDDVYRELFDAKKYQYNLQHNYKIRGYDVELYVQNAAEPVESLGEYSVLNDTWIRIPKKRRANFNQRATKSKFENLKKLSSLALSSSDETLVKKLIKIIKKYRQAGLDQHGEFGPENLAYKILRTQGYIQKLYDHYNLLKDQRLSVESIQERKKSKKKKKSKFAWGGYWGPGLGYYDSESDGDAGGLGEASYPGNIGMMEVFQAFQMANPQEKQMLKQLIDQKKDDLAWALIQKITGVRLQGDQFNRHSGDISIDSENPRKQQ